MSDATRLNPFVFGLATLACAVGGYVWFVSTHHEVQEERVTGYAGPARTNPHYLLEAFLGEAGYATQALDAPPPAPPESAALFWLSQAPMEEWVLPWVASGSHLLTDEDPFLGGLDFAQGGQDAADSWPAGELVQRQYVYGEGCVTVLSSSVLLTNPALPESGRPAQLLSALSCSEWLDGALLYSPRGMPWFGWTVAEHGWPVLLALALALTLVLWRAARAFGPRLREPSPARRSMLEHLAAVGHLAARTRSVDSLCEATRRELLKRLAGRVPGVSTLSGQALVERVARTTGVDEGVVQAALCTPVTREPARWVVIARAQQQLWRL